jgi:transcriptional regulator with XRE-family HTH domain
MNIGETIKKLRKQKDMTQEQLAGYLNISPQAVSRWEINSTLPDIALVPMLANIFDVSTDVLFGVDIENKEKRIQDIIGKSDEHTFNGFNVKESTETLREGLKEYPNSHKIMSSLMWCLWRELYGKTHNEEQIGTLKEIIGLGEKILAECTDDKCRHNAIYVLCNIYPDPQIGEQEKALKLADKMPDGRFSRESLLVNIYQGTAKFEQKRSKLYHDIADVLWGLCPWDTLDDGNSPHTPEECIVLYQKMIKLLELIFDDENYLAYRFFLSNAYYGIAQNYAVLENYENSIINLSLAAEQAMLCDGETVSGYGILESAIPPFRGMHLYVRPVRPEKMYSDGLREKMANISAFDAIRENKEFVEIGEKLKKYTNYK